MNLQEEKNLITERKMNMEIKIENTNGKPTVSSIQVAKDFEKEHKNVIQTIKNLTAENSAVKDMFIENTYFTERGRQYKCYEITRDGFSLLVMGFTGKKALEWKLKYIEAFNKMEQCIKSSLVKKPDSYMIEDEVERAKRWIEEAEERRKLALTVKEQTNVLKQQEPLVHFAKTVASTEDCIDMNNMAKLIGQKTGISVGRNKLFAILRNNKFLMYDNQPYQKYIEDGTFSTLEYTYMKNGEARIGLKTLVTGKGQIKICKFIKHYAENLLANCSVSGKEVNYE